MKKTIIIVFALLIFCTMSGCRSDDDIYMNYIAIYENEIYDEVKFWYPISNDWEEVSAWVGFEKYVSEPVQYTKNAMFLKNDIDHRFLAYDSKLDDLHFFINVVNLCQLRIQIPLKKWFLHTALTRK